jgi:hypothetical protein
LFTDFRHLLCNPNNLSTYYVVTEYRCWCHCASPKAPKISHT